MLWDLMQTLSLSWGVAEVVSVGLWITGTCSGGEVEGDTGGGVSSRLLRPSSTGGANHSVTTSTSSSDGRSHLISFRGGGSMGLWILRMTKPTHIFFKFKNRTDGLNSYWSSAPHLHICKQMYRDPGRHGNGRPSLALQSERPEAGLWFLSGPHDSDSEPHHSCTMDHIHTAWKQTKHNKVIEWSSNDFNVISYDLIYTFLLNLFMWNESLRTSLFKKNC